MSNITALKPKYDFTIADKVEHLRTLDRELKRVTKAYNVLKDDVIAAIGDSDRIVNQYGHEVATYITQSREAFAVKEFKQEHPELAEKYVSTTEYKVFRLK